MKHHDDEPVDERHLFREAVQDVRPLARVHPVPVRRKPKPRARFTRQERQSVLQESLYGEAGDPTQASDPALIGGEELVYRRPGVQDSVLRKLRRGQYRVQAEIDLHGLTAAEAKQALREFLSEALARDLTCIRIVHGKGLRSGPRGPVLKNTVSGVLKRIDAVLAFVSARQVDGGTGAMYVLLARR